MTEAVANPVGQSTPRARALEPVAVLIWLAACAITVFFALLLVDSAIVDGLYMPRTNDSLYHARRIVDAAVGSRGFYEFDERMHVPEGTWISWPWAYDYFMSRLSAFGVWLDPGSDPLALVFYVPVAWVFVNAALFLAICRAVHLSIPMQALALLCFALSPLNQLLHSVGMLDHHYIELTFVLLTVWLGLRWFEDLNRRSRAIALGVALGAAPAFHNGLFILQLLPLIALFALWLRNTALPRSTLQVFAITLLITTQLIVLPSEPYRRGMFEFGLLSWFHVYIAVCTAGTTLFLSRIHFTKKHLLALCALCTALLVPLASQAMAGAGFLSGSFSILGLITEAQSPYTLYTVVFGSAATLGYYSYLLFVAPAVAAYFAYRVFSERAPHRLYFAIAAAFGVTMLLTQFRLHYFGYFALVTGPLLAIDALRTRFRWHAGATFAAAFAAIALAFQPALRERLFVVNPLGSAQDYQNVLPLYLRLASLCEAEPGLVLASSDDGSGVLFHTECSVISNNFILRPSDETHLNELWRLMHSSPEEIVQQRPDIKYVLLRARDFLSTFEGGVELSKESPIAQQLLTNREPPANFELMHTVWLEVGPGENDVAILARLFRVTPPGDVVPVHSNAEAVVSSGDSGTERLK